jgi:DNA-binding NarL/FixJ family response regulator
VLQAIKRGAMGFIPKVAAKDVIVNATRLVLAGGVYLPPEAIVGEGRRGNEMTDASGPRSLADLGLTVRQGQVLALIMRGRSNKEICRTLGLAERTVKVHVTAVLTALRVSSRTQAVIAATQLGLDADALFATGSSMNC